MGAFVRLSSGKLVQVPLDVLYLPRPELDAWLETERENKTPAVAPPKAPRISAPPPVPQVPTPPKKRGRGKAHRACKGCGERFSPTANRQQYCEPECRETARNERRASRARSR